jgi:colanic acid/amylovoran biosynthesis glycosyltransferase
MRVAYLLQAFPETSEIFILNEVVEVLRRGIDVRVFSQIPPKRRCPHADLRYLDGRIEYLPEIDGAGFLGLLVSHGRFMLRRPFGYFRALAYSLGHREDAGLWAFKVCVRYAEVLERFRPNLIHTHFAYGNARFAMLVAMLLNVEYTFTIHGWHDLYKVPPRNLRDIIVRSRRTITVCDFNRTHLVSQYGVPCEKVVVVRCGIPIERFGRYDHQKKSRLIVSVGRLHYHKAHHVLIRACAILKERRVEFNCWIVGDGSLRNELEHLIEEYGLGRDVKLLGEKSNEEVSEILGQAQVFALTSQVEVVGLAYAEAMASQLPVVGSAVFGVPELIEDSVVGYVCAPGDSSAIAARLEFLLENEAICREMGERGRVRVSEMHDLHKQGATLVDLWG